MTPLFLQVTSRIPLILGVGIALGCFSIASPKDSPLNVSVREFITDKQALLDTNPPPGFGYPELFFRADFGLGSTRRDPTFVRNPRVALIQNSWCYSKDDSWPRCTSYVDLKSQRLTFVTNSFFNRDSLIHHTQGVPLYTFAENYDRQLRAQLALHGDSILAIETRKYEKVDRSLAFFDALFYGLPIMGGLALAELFLSGFADRAYDPSHFAIPAAAFMVGYGGYQAFTWDHRPTLTIIRIRVE